MTTPKNKRLPKARVHHALVAHYRGFIRATHEAKAMKATPDDYYCPCAVIPAPTAKQARQIVKAAPFPTMTEEEQVEAIAAVACPELYGDALKEVANAYAAQCRLFASAVLAAIHGGGT